VRRFGRGLFQTPKDRNRIDEMRRLALFLAALTLVVGAAACGGEEDETATPETVEGTLSVETGGGSATEGDPAKGKEIYASAGCGGCHTFGPAGSSGTVGPNLDEAKPSLDLAIDRVTNGQGGMPSFKGQLSEAQIEAVAKFVADNAGK
jgi:mono/diheme cytochrome c family protein